MPRGRSRRKRASERRFPKLEVVPEVVSDLAGLALIFIGTLLTLSFFNIAGPLAEPVEEVFRLFFGYVSYALPVPLFIFAVGLIWPDRLKVGLNPILGALILVITSSALVDLLAVKVLNQPTAAIFGGYIGQVLNSAGLSVISLPLWTVLLSLIFIAGAIIALNRPLRSLKIFEPSERLPDKVVVNQPMAEPPRLSRLSPKEAEEALRPITMHVKDASWEPYSLDLLEQDAPAVRPSNISKNLEVIKATFANFGIDVEMGEVNVGPTVTQYTMKPIEGVKLTQITGLSDNLALALAAHPIRIDAPIPGKSLVGIEVPNKEKSLVRLRGMLGSETFMRKREPLTIPLGRAVAGEPILLDIASLPHLLIAGQTNSGKSVAINSILLSLLYRNSPRDLRLILVDPKHVELTGYNGIPHLLSPVVVEPKEAVSALKWSILEMERRFKLFADSKKRNIDEYNQSGAKDHVPRILIVIDELATLMQLSIAEVEAAVIRLAQMSRATGIHLVLATQRPESNVITGLIKSNIPARVAFAVASQIDSRIVLDTGGAEKLLGAGDMLYQTSDMSRPKRVQGVFVSEKEIHVVSDFLKKKGTASYESAVLSQPVKISGKGRSLMSEAEIPDDELFAEAAEEVIRQGKASASLLQRRLKVGYARAARLLDLLEERGVIGPGEGAKPRDILVESVDEIGPTPSTTPQSEPES